MVLKRRFAAVLRISPYFVYFLIIMMMDTLMTQTVSAARKFAAVLISLLMLLPSFIYYSAGFIAQPRRMPI